MSSSALCIKNLHENAQNAVAAVTSQPKPTLGASCDFIHGMATTFWGMPLSSQMCGAARAITVYWFTYLTTTASARQRQYRIVHAGILEDSHPQLPFQLNCDIIRLLILVQPLRYGRTKFSLRSFADHNGLLTCKTRDMYHAHKSARQELLHL